MIAWRPFLYEDQSYDLSHLHPLQISFTQAAKALQPERIYRVQVIFGLHCFTRGRNETDASNSSLEYADSREVRIFDFLRYKQSKLLPKIIQALPTTACYMTGHGNFFTVHAVDIETLQELSYEVYFKASRSTDKRVDLNLFIQSAYVRDELHGNRPQSKGRKKIGFFVILQNTLHNRVIKLPP